MSNTVGAMLNVQPLAAEFGQFALSRKRIDSKDFSISWRLAGFALSTANSRRYIGGVAIRRDRSSSAWLDIP